MRKQQINRSSEAVMRLRWNDAVNHDCATIEFNHLVATFKRTRGAMNRY